MKTLDRYILKKFLSGLVGTIIAFSVIVLVVDFVERGWRMTQRYDVGFDIIGWYYVNYMPFYIILAFPVAMLVSTLFSMGSLARNHELDVMKASGLSLYRISIPILAAAFVVSIGVMFFGEFVLTGCEKRKDEIKSTLIEKRSRPSKLTRSNVKVPGKDGWILLSRTYNISTEKGQDVKVHRIVSNEIVKTYIAEKIISTDSGWVLLNGSVQEFFDEATGFPDRYARFDTLWAPFLTQTPEMLAELPVPPRQVDFFSLKRRIDQKKMIGEPTRKDEVELYLKITFPFANFILALIGLPLAANPRRSGPSVGFGISIITSFIFFVLIRTGQSLGNNGKLPPLLAASLGDLVFLAIGIGMMVKARK
jgi:lipopolysaccharide export system permease protein